MRVALTGRGDFEEWRRAARALLMAGVPPERVAWEPADGGQLFDPPPPLPDPAPGAAAPGVPAGFLSLARSVICHADPVRFGLLYRLLWRLMQDRQLLGLRTDPDVVAAARLEKVVRRDAHKMTAFVRFREAGPPGPTGRRRFVAWFEPDHYVVARTAPFFRGRFADMDWMILTPRGSAAFDGATLTVSAEPATRPDLADETEALWLTYYAGIFNPARLKPRAMRAEMPVKYWANLPEAALIPDLIAGAEARVRGMAETAGRPAPAFHHRLAARRVKTGARDGASPGELSPGDLQPGPAQPMLADPMVAPGGPSHDKGGGPRGRS